MPDFSTHCQNIGHHVSVCRRIHPRKEKENNTEKEKVAQGKKQMPTQRIEWVPLKDNPSGIGSSAAFQQPVSRSAATEEALPIQHSSPPPVSKKLDNLETQQQPTSNPAAENLPIQHSSPQHVPSEEENLQTFDTSQQQPTSDQAGTHQDIHSTEEFVALEATLQHNEAEDHSNNEDNISLMQAAPLPQKEITVQVPHNSFTLNYMHMPEEVGRIELGADHDTVLSPVTEKSLDVSSIVAASNAPVNTKLQKEVDFMNNWLAKAAETETPYIPVISKAQKKKGAKNSKSSYQTRSLGSLPPFK
jgi:hypothetical protein